MSMRRSMLWFLISAAWALDCVLALVHSNRQQVVLTAFFAAVFLAVGLLYRKKERRTPRSRRS